MDKEQDTLTPRLDIGLDTGIEAFSSPEAPPTWGMPEPTPPVSGLEPDLMAFDDAAYKTNLGFSKQETNEWATPRFEYPQQAPTDDSFKTITRTIDEPLDHRVTAIRGYYDQVSSGIFRDAKSNTERLQALGLLEVDFAAAKNDLFNQYYPAKIKELFPDHADRKAFLDELNVSGEAIVNSSNPRHSDAFKAINNDFDKLVPKEPLIRGGTIDNKNGTPVAQYTVLHTNDNKAIAAVQFQSQDEQGNAGLFDKDNVIEMAWPKDEEVTSEVASIREQAAARRREAEEYAKPPRFVDPGDPGGGLTSMAFTQQLINTTKQKADNLEKEAKALEIGGPAALVERRIEEKIRTDEKLLSQIRSPGFTQEAGKALDKFIVNAAATVDSIPGWNDFALGLSAYAGDAVEAMGGDKSSLGLGQYSGSVVGQYADVMKTIDETRPGMAQTRMEGGVMNDVALSTVENWPQIAAQVGMVAASGGPAALMGVNPGAFATRAASLAPIMASVPGQALGRVEGMAQSAMGMESIGELQRKAREDQRQLDAIKREFPDSEDIPKMEEDLRALEDSIIALKNKNDAKAEKLRDKAKAFAMGSLGTEILSEMIFPNSQARIGFSFARGVKEGFKDVNKEAFEESFNGFMQDFGVNPIIDEYNNPMDLAARSKEYLSGLAMFGFQMPLQRGINRAMFGTQEQQQARQVNAAAASIVASITQLQQGTTPTPVDTRSETITDPQGVQIKNPNYVSQGSNGKFVIADDEWNQRATQAGVPTEFNTQDEADAMAQTRYQNLFKAEVQRTVGGGEVERQAAILTAAQVFIDAARVGGGTYSPEDLFRMILVEPMTSQSQAASAPPATGNQAATAAPPQALPIGNPWVSNVVPTEQSLPAPAAAATSAPPAPGTGAPGAATPPAAGNQSAPAPKAPPLSLEQLGKVRNMFAIKRDRLIEKRKNAQAAIDSIDAKGLTRGVTVADLAAQRKVHEDEISAIDKELVEVGEDIRRYDGKMLEMSKVTPASTGQPGAAPATTAPEAVVSQQDVESAAPTNTIPSTDESAAATAASAQQQQSANGKVQAGIATEKTQAAQSSANDEAGVPEIEIENSTKPGGKHADAARIMEEKVRAALKDPLIRRLYALSRAKIIIGDNAKSRDLLGKDLGKSSFGWTWRLPDGNIVVFINAQNHSGKRVDWTVAHEGIHAADRAFRLTKKGARLYQKALEVFTTGNSNFDKKLNKLMLEEYPGYRKLGAPNKLAEAVRAVLAGKLLGNTLSRKDSFKSYLKEFLGYIKGLFVDGPASGALGAYVQNLEAFIESGSAADIELNEEVDEGMPSEESSETGNVSMVDGKVSGMTTSAIQVLYGDSAALPKPAEKVTNDAVAKQLQQEAYNQWGDRIITSKDITPEQEELIVKNGVEEFTAAMAASGKNAGDWYTANIEAAMAIAEVIHPELQSDENARAIKVDGKSVFESKRDASIGMYLAMAITSQNLAVDENTKYSEEQFSVLKQTGKYDSSRVYGSKAKSISANLNLANKLISKVGWRGVDELLSRDFTVGELSKAASKLLGKKVTIAGRVNDIVQGAAIFGPKIGQGFLQNLMGNYYPVTIDLWMRRTWGRWTGDVLGTGLTGDRLARLIDSVKKAKLPTNATLSRQRPVMRQTETGTPIRTMNEEFLDQLENDESMRDELFQYAKDIARLWNRRYDAVKKGITQNQFEALRDKTSTMDRVSLALIKAEDDMNAKWDALPAKKRPKGAGAKEEWKNALRKKAGRTVMLTTDDWSNMKLKPEWALAANVIVSKLKPIDAPTDQDRAVISRIVNKIRLELEATGVIVSNADIQAVLWYPEKDLWAKLRGEPESNLKQSYEEEFQRLAKERGLEQEAAAASARVRAARSSRRNDGGSDGRIRGVSDQQEVGEDGPTEEVSGEEDADLWDVPIQSITSADTSINDKKTAATFTKVPFQSGTLNADIGGGRFNNATELLEQKGVTNVIFDPFNRPREENIAASNKIRDGKSDTTTVNNVLNVIQEKQNRDKVIRQAANAVKPDGVSYFLIYEGNGSGVGKATSKGWQENRKTKDYLDEIGVHYQNVRVRNGVIEATDPIKKSSENTLSQEASGEDEYEMPGWVKAISKASRNPAVANVGAIMSFSKASNFSTVIHELGHVLSILQVNVDPADPSKGTRSLLEEMTGPRFIDLYNFATRDGRIDPSTPEGYRAYLERISEGFERFLVDGDVPVGGSKGIVEAFKVMRSAMKKVLNSYRAQGMPYGINLPDDEELTEDIIDAYQEILFHIGQSEKRSEWEPPIATEIQIANRMHLESIARLSQDSNQALYQRGPMVAYKDLQPMIDAAVLTVRQKNNGLQPDSFDQFKAMIDPASPLLTLNEGQLQLVYNAAAVAMPNNIELSIKEKIEAAMAVPLTSLVADVAVTTDLIQQAMASETDAKVKARLNTILEQADTSNSHDQLRAAQVRATRAIGAAAAAKARSASTTLRTMMAGYRAGKKDTSIAAIADEVRIAFGAYAKASGVRRSTKAMVSQILNGAKLAENGKISPMDFLVLVEAASTAIEQDFAASAAIAFNRGIADGTKATVKDVKRRAELLKQIVEGELQSIGSATKPIVKVVLKALDGVTSTRKLVKAAYLITKAFQSRRTREAYSRAKKLAESTKKNLKKRGMFGPAASDVATLVNIRTSDIPPTLLPSYLGLVSYLGQNSKEIVIDDTILKSIQAWNTFFKNHLIANPPVARGVSAASASARAAEEATKKAQAMIDYDIAKKTLDRDKFVDAYINRYGKTKEQALTALDFLEKFLPKLESADSIDLDHMNSAAINGVISSFRAFNEGIVQSQLISVAHELGIRETHETLMPVLQQAVRHILTSDATVNLQGLTPNELEQRTAGIASALLLFSHNGKYNKKALSNKLAKAGLSHFDTLLGTVSKMSEMIVSPLTQLHFEGEINKQRLLEAGNIYPDAKAHESEQAMTPAMLDAMKKSGLLDVSIWQGTTNFLAPVAAAVGATTRAVVPPAARSYRREAASRIIGIAAIQRQREANGWSNPAVPSADDNYVLWLLTGGPGSVASELGRREAVRQQRAAIAIMEALAGAPPTWANIEKVLSADNLKAMSNADLVFQQTGEIIHYLNMMDESAPLDWFEKYYPINDMSGKPEDLGKAATMASRSMMPQPSSLGVQASSRNRRTDTQLKLVDADFFGVTKSHVAQATGDASMSPFLNRMNEAMNRIRRSGQLGGTGSSVVEDIQEQLLEHGHRVAQNIFFDSDVPSTVIAVVASKLKERFLSNIFRPLFETFPSLARAFISSPKDTFAGMKRYHTASKGFPDKLMFDLRSNIAMRGGSASLDIQFANLNAAFSSLLNSDFRLPSAFGTISKSAALSSKLPTGKGLFGWLQSNYVARASRAITQVLVTSGETIVARPFWYGTFTRSLEEQSGIPWSEDNYTNGAYTEEQIKRAQALAETQVSRKFAESTPGTQPTFALEKLTQDDGALTAFFRYIAYAFTNYSGAQTRDFKAGMQAMIDGNAAGYDRRDALANMASVVTSYALNTILVTTMYQAMSALMKSGNPEEDKRRKERWKQFKETLSGQNGWDETRSFYLKMGARSMFSSLMGDQSLFRRMIAAAALEGGNYAVGKGATWMGAYDPYKDNVTFEIPPSFSNALLGALPMKDERIRGEQDTNVSTIMSAHQFLGIVSGGIEQAMSVTNSAENLYNATIEGEAVDATASAQNLGFFALMSINLLPVSATAFGAVKPKEMAADTAYASRNESKDERTAEKEARIALDEGDASERREKMVALGPKIADHFDQNLAKWAQAKAEMSQFSDEDKNRIMTRALDRMIGVDSDLLNQTFTRQYRQMIEAGMGKEFLRSVARLSQAGFSSMPSKTRGSDDAESLRDFEQSKFSDGISAFRDYYHQTQIMQQSLTRQQQRMVRQEMLRSQQGEGEDAAP